MKYFLNIALVLIIFNFAPSVHAASNPVNALNYSLYQISTEIQNQLKETQQITSSEIKKLFEEYSTVPPQSFTYQDQVMIITGSSGTAKNTTARSIYGLNVKPISGYNVSIPESVNLNKGKIIIPVGLTPGTGTVKKAQVKPTMMAKISDWFDNKVYAQDPNSEVSVVTYYDKNGNGKWDRSEDIIPWAGVTVELTDLNATLRNSNSDVSFFDNIPFFKMQLGGQGR